VEPSAANEEMDQGHRGGTTKGYSAQKNASAGTGKAPLKLTILQKETEAIPYKENNISRPRQASIVQLGRETGYVKGRLKAKKRSIL